ncbi:MAG TPA: Rnf-Nqr domain containing protein, partial [Mariniflexile sp.]|nr:Rnf-Nqr domain containing protein [Mariniflexile sp.]
MDYVIILIAAVFVNNIVLSQFLGICPFLGVSNKVSTSVGMSGAVLFVMTIATTVTYLLHQYVLIPAGLDYLRTISFILVIAALVQMVEIILKKVSPSLYQALGVFLPLITTNCAVLGVAILALGLENGSLLKAVFFAISNSLGFALALIVFASIREHLELANLPKV